MDPRARHRKAGRAEVVEGMAEGVDAIAVDGGDRARAAERQVAADETDANGVARRERRGRRGRRPGGAAARHRREAAGGKAGGDEVGDVAAEAAHHERRGDGPEHRAQLSAVQSAQPGRPDIRRRLGEGVGAREDLLERGGQRRGAEREVQLGAGAAADGAAAGAPRRVNHFINRRDAGDGLSRERRQGNRRRRRPSGRRCTPGCRSCRR